MSQLFLVVVVGGALAAMVGLLQVIGDRGAERADAARLQVAEAVAAGVVRPHLVLNPPAQVRLAAGQDAALREAVGQLRRDGHLHGLGVWQLDGTPIFLDVEAVSLGKWVSAADLARAGAGQSWSEHAAAADGSTVLRVFVPIEMDPRVEAAVSSAVVAGVVIPHGALAQAEEHELLRQQVTTVVLFLLMVSTVVWSRYRVLRREKHARQDPLTGLLNRRALQEDAPALLAHATPQAPVALCIIDLAQFKTVNDTLGHTAGDQLLEQVAAQIKGAVRGSDLVVRLGGDEFAVLLTDLRGVATARTRADQLLRKLQDTTFTVQGIELSVDASIGVALAPEHGGQAPELLQRADVAMYQAKRSHRGVVVYDSSTDGHTIGQLAMVTELRRALDNDEFVLHYQPKISLADQRVVGVEALVRWQHPARGLLPPGEFLPVMEASGLMQPLTQRVLRHAVHQAASWRRAGMPLKVAVNIGPRSLLEPDFSARVLATLVGAELPASLLELEITETAVMTNPERAAFVLSQLRARGIHVSIDDFGAGYTSLAFLRILPVAALKIDRSLVTHILDCPEDEAVTQAVIDLAHRLGLSVVAEGPETDAVLDRLAALGCDEAQGYAISRPLNPAALEGWLTQRHVDHPATTDGANSRRRSLP
ncbi:putative bifunctional diguanylate cyclase/phosphodiesterase [Blastococcus saxobsidens]|uniref:Diguanylate cyclase/phosphodiesterase n=1 Tax=Blastococcus saxobsidens (strain DD2) TaxID=1146883 RepID=H6RRK2_BLASD|nr:EAL domain-containing protein [Blastococcus saxobsidens]CCG01645.1 Diguanylate cyclase/phosphodiesterase [Blastococcus saxobsidens DD2]